MALGLCILALAFPVSRLIRNRPEEYGLRPDGAPAAPRRAASTLEGQPAAGRVEPAGPDADLTVAQALRTPAFWLISFGHGFTVVAVPAIYVHLGLLLEDAGFQVQTTAWVVSVFTGVGMVFQLVGAYVGGKIPTRVALFIFATLQASGVALLTLPSNLTMVFLFAVLLGAGWGGRNPLTVAIRGEYFGQGSFGKILGLSAAPMNVMMLASAPFAGYIYDRTDSYNIAFLTLALVTFAGGVLFLMARRPPRSPASSRPEVA
jgi:MFS family permease